MRVSIPVDCFIFLPACPSLARIYKNTPNSDFYKQQVLVLALIDQLDFSLRHRDGWLIVILAILRLC